MSDPLGDAVDTAIEHAGADAAAGLAEGRREATGRGVMKAGHAVSERARKLPPASAFGRGSGGRFSWVSRSGIGLG